MDVDKLQQQLMDEINGQLKNTPKSELEAESQNLMKKLNESANNKHVDLILNGETEKIIDLIERGWLSLDKIYLLPVDFFRKGEFEKCYKCLNTAVYIFNYFDQTELINNVESLRNIFLQFGYDESLPEPFDYTYKQSIENADETYNELKFIKQLKLATTENEFNNMINTIEEQLHSNNYELKANAYFIKGDIHFLQDNYKEAIYYYTQAISINPNKALYWGYMAQLLNRIGESPYISTRYCMKAIELDPQNARWHLLQSIILLKLVKLGVHDLTDQAIAEGHLALGLCRHDQKTLKYAIMKYISSK